jgi:putative spermidine/putrescine transport system ATP-binding protein
MARLQLTALTKTYGDVRAVAGVDLDIAEGELVVLLGPSGCGKTTTLRMIAGFVAPTAGEIRLGGQDITRRPPWKRNTGLVFQSYALFPHLTAAANIAFGMRMRNLPQPRIDAKLAEVLRLVRLEGLADRLPRELSGGQQQRVALARALVIEPDILLLDEPLSNLDAKLRAEVRVEIRELQRKLGLTTVMVTHDQEEALTMADRLVVMSNGKVQQVGSQRELYEHPVNAFVAGFVGAHEFRAAATSKRRASSAAKAVWRSDAARVLPPQAGLLALRPERLSLATAPVAGADNCFPGVVEFASYLGGILEYYVRLTPRDRLMVQAPNTLADPSHAIGDRIHLHWPAQASLVLADDGGNAS